MPVKVCLKAVTYFMIMLSGVDYLYDDLIAGINVDVKFNQE